MVISFLVMNCYLLSPYKADFARDPTEALKQYSLLPPFPLSLALPSPLSEFEKKVKSGLGELKLPPRGARHSSPNAAPGSPTLKSQCGNGV